MPVLQSRMVVLAAVAMGARAGLVPFSEARACTGRESQLRPCGNLPKCHRCEPEDCVFAAWGDWFHGGGCTGVCFRERDVAVANNECGAPCQGLKQETKQCLDASCVLVPQDCMFSDWSSWSECGSDFTAQKHRSRTIALQPQYGGRECVGAVNETQPCGPNPAVDCTLSTWGAWTHCSASCGGGWRSQTRRPLTRARLGGKPCEGAMSRAAPCGEQPCGTKRDCALGAWSAWTGCSLLSGVQRYRTRAVETPSAFGGKPCGEAVKETLGCPSNAAEAEPCRLTDWAEWAECSRSCGGGQSFRKRQLEKGPQHGGECAAESLHETRPCGAEPCEPLGDCGLSSWGDWSDCSAKCGVGVAMRVRSVISRARPGGVGCNAALREARGCQASEEECGVTDCAWADWEQWSACSCTCGGGTMRRERMIGVAPARGGLPCSAEQKAQVVPCNTQSCDVCVDGAWANWQEWTPCSATCDRGFRSRHRDVAQHPNGCGAPVSGLEDEYEQCFGDAPCVADNDCQLSDWTVWSACSSNCFGVATRQRSIARFATGNGKTCHMEAAKEVAQCNPSVGEPTPEECGVPSAEPCVLDMWSDWGVCSATCNGGQKVRQRRVLSPAKNGGTPCSGELSMTAPCALQSWFGDVQNCEWGQWSDWGQCSKCGDQRYRHRSISKLANAMGTPCDPAAAKEVSSCNSTCEGRQFCAWSDWSGFSPCSAQCGPATRVRQRAMVAFTTAPIGSYLFEGPSSTACSGAQMDIGACAFQPCGKTVDCIFSFWSEWSAPTCTQLCERSRVIEQVNENDGEFCRGPLVETKRCARDCTHAEDCELSPWGEWGHCESHEAQRYRSRSVAQYASNGGKECEGNLEETASCSGPLAAITSCVFGLWSDWGECSEPCEGGLRTRERAIQDPATNGGAMCEGGLLELSTCNPQKCGEAASCVLGEWSHWSNCTAEGSRSRERKVLREPQFGGQACGGVLRELAGCSRSTDCELSPWTAWDDCDKTCGGGQRLRHRQVVQSPMEGGQRCSPELMEIQGCNQAPCNRQACKVSSWSEWSPCSATCGSGQQLRGRKVVELPRDGGEGCHMGLQETRECKSPNGQPLGACATVDCVWGLWSDWSSCSCKCDGGMRTRDRHIIQVPEKGGRSCSAWDKEEAEPCNLHPCDRQKCVDGLWDDWQDWEPCSATCNGGLTWRSRKVLREANECGKPVTGEARVERSCYAGVACEPDVDCALSDWGAWSGCSKMCSGIMRRSREIAVPGRGRGAACAGDLKQTAPCGASGLECGSEVQADCALADWQAWEPCSVSCGGGQQRRSRNVASEAMGGGHCPLAALAEARACSEQACPDQCLPSDCKWNDWSGWSACDKCGGEKRRFRHVQKVAHCGGRACDAGLSEEVANCTRKCHEPSYCAFGAWGSWGTCSSTCGSGVQKRARHLEITSEAEVLSLQSDHDSSLVAEFQLLREETEALRKRHVQSLALSFSGGLLSLLVGFTVVRAYSRLQWASKREVGVTAE